MFHARVSSRGRITLPVALRAKLNLAPGSHVHFEEQPDGSFVIRRKNADIRELRGIVKYDGPPVSIEDMSQAIAATAAERYKHSTGNSRAWKV